MILGYFFLRRDQNNLCTSWVRPVHTLRLCEKFSIVVNGFWITLAATIKEKRTFSLGRGGHVREVVLSQVLTCWVLLLVTVMMLKSVHVNSMTSNITVDLLMCGCFPMDSKKTNGHRLETSAFSSPYFEWRSKKTSSVNTAVLNSH